MHYFILFPSQLVGQWLDPGWMFKWIYNYLSTKPVDQMKDSSMMIWMEPKIQLVQKVGHTMFLINNLVISLLFCRTSTQGIKKLFSTPYPCLPTYILLIARAYPYLPTYNYWLLMWYSDFVHENVSRACREQHRQIEVIFISRDGN